MQRAENEAEADENQSDSGEHDGPSVSVPAAGGVSTAGVEASLPDVASLQLPPSPVNDATAAEVVSDVLCSASRKVEENVPSSDPATTHQSVDTAPDSTHRTSSASDNLAVVSSDSQVNVDSHVDCQTSRDTEADDKPSSCTLQSKPGTDDTGSGCTCTSLVVDGTDAGELFAASYSSVSADVSAQTEGQHDRVTATEKNDAVNTDKSPTSPGECDFLFTSSLNYMITYCIHTSTAAVTGRSTAR